MRQLEFDTSGNDKQKEVARLWADPRVSDIVYGGSKGSGKSYLGCNLIFGDALTYPETFYFIARDSLTNIRKFTIPSIHEVLTSWEIGPEYYHYNGQDNFYELYNKSRVYLLDAKYLPSDPLFARFGSMQMTRGWIEEAGEFTEAAKNNLGASIGRWKNDIYKLSPKLLQTCNPAKNYLYSDYYKKNKNGNLEDWKRFVQALPQDNKRLPAGYLENLNRILTVNEKERLLKGNWEYDDDPAALIEYNAIINLWSNSHVQEGTHCLTCDVARFGRDKSIIRVWKGFKCIRRIKLKKASTTEVANKINELRVQYQIPAFRCVIDEDGVGGGVVDQVPGSLGFVNNSSAIAIRSAEGFLVPQNYNNLKSQCYFLMADRINNGGYWLADETSEDDREEIIAELEQVKQKNMDKEGKRQVVSKDEVKALLGRSPDDSDCMMMREYLELVKVEHYVL